MIIDAHVHIFPDKIANKTVEKLKSVANIPAYTDGTLKGIRASMQDAGIDYSLILPIATRPGQTTSINSFAQTINGTDGIISFGSVHPEDDNLKEELKKIKNAGLLGIKLHPDYQNIYVDDLKMLRLLSFAADLGLIVTVHGGVDVGYPKVHHCTPKRVANVLKEIDGLKLIVAHTGGYLYWEDTLEYLAGQDVYLDTSFTVTKCDNDLFLKIIRNHDINKILFATDSPWDGQKKAVQELKETGLTHEELDHIFYKNAANLLCLPV